MNLTCKRSLQKLLLPAAALLSLATVVRAQHYPDGAEGIRGATLPPPGVYLRDYNFFYFADRFPGGPPGFDAFAYVNAPRLIWITEQKILGADYGMDIIVPFGYTRVKFAGLEDHRFGLHDIQIEPLLLSWHLQQFDFAGGYAVWAPTGDFDTSHFVNLGEGFWTHMLTAGATWYPDTEKTWAISVLNRYEINQEQQDTHVTYGQTFTMELGVSKTVAKGLDVGLVGYWSQQVTENTGPFTTDSLSHVFALGPEISGVIPKIGVIVSARYLREFAAKDASEGNTVVLTLTKRF